MGEDGNPGFVEDGFLYAAHPDPSWARRGWISLDGVWKARRGRKVREVLVPFPIGSERSGADFPDRGLFLYERDFELPPGVEGRSALLRIGACDYETAVMVNGREAGGHTGGYASFELDVSDALRPGRNEIVLRVRDSHSPFQVRGKQTFLRKPFMVWYSGVSGPWQPLWLELAGSAYLDRPRIRTDFVRGVVRIEARALRPGGRRHAAPVSDHEASAHGPLRLVLEAESPEGRAAAFETLGRPDSRGGAGFFELDLPLDAFDGPLWSPDAPRLHKLRYTLYEGGEVQDIVESYIGLRRFEARGGRLLLNGNPIRLRAALVQGYYPEGWYAPPTPEGYREDIRTLKRMGFNGARIHQKIESPYFHYLCDRLGLLTTFEMPSFYLPSRRAFRAYESELREIVARDASHPSGVAWVLFNETWGIWGIYGRRSRTRAFVRAMTDMVRDLDPGRPVIDNSGWEHLETDIVDVHHYLKSSTLARAAYGELLSRTPVRIRGVSALKVILFYVLNRIGVETRPVFLDAPSEEACGDAPWLLSEYGGFGWYESAESGSAADRIEAYTRDASESGLFQGYCLTQLYDVGVETNGILGFDRKPKMPEDRVRAINSIPFAAGNRLRQSRQSDHLRGAGQ